MIVYIIRHGIAVDVGQQGVRTDAGRMLSEEGRTRTRQAAEGLKAIGVRPAAVWSSPLVRAVQTAEIMARELGAGVAVEKTDAMLPGSDPAELIVELARSGVSSVAVVGHMPHVSDVASRMLAHRDTVTLVFKKAGAAAIEFDGKPAEGAGWLLWLLQPKALRTLGC